MRLAERHAHEHAEAELRLRRDSQVELRAELRRATAASVAAIDALKAEANQAVVTATLDADRRVEQHAAEFKAALRGTTMAQSAEEEALVGRLKVAQAQADAASGAAGMADARLHTVRHEMESEVPLARSTRVSWRASWVRTRKSLSQRFPQ